MKKIKILFYGDSPTAATGFGTVSKEILTGLHATGRYDITVLGINYWGDPHNFPFPIYPIAIGGSPSAPPDPYGRQRAAEMMRDLQYDVLFQIQDSFILQFMDSALPQLKACGKKFAHVVYFPIDGKPKEAWIKSMSAADVPVTYTQFGKKMCEDVYKSIIPKLAVIPHGSNTKIFKPLPKETVASFRREFFQNNADKYIVCNVNRNQPRKDIPRTMLAFKQFLKRRPNSLLYLHCASADMGWNLEEVARTIGLRVGEELVFPANFGPNQGYPIEVLNLIYNACNIVVSTTLGEGWGLSSCEAMACRTPILFPNNTSLTEIIGSDEERGYLAESGKGFGENIVLSNDNDVVRPLTNLQSFVEKLLEAHDNPEQAIKKANIAYNWIHQNMIWKKHIVPQWEKIIKKAIAVRSKAAAPSNGIISAEEL